MEVALKLLSNLGVNNTLFLMIAIFLGTYVLMLWIALRKLSNAIIERDTRTQGRVSNIESFNQDLAELNEKLTLQNKALQVESSNLFSELKVKAQEEQALILKQARDQSASHIKSARDELQVGLQNELKKSHAEIPALAQQIVAKLLTASKKTQRSDSTSVRSEV